MAIFTKNKNPKALLGNQNLFKICCGDSVLDPCCYSTDQPRPEPCFECGRNIIRDYVVGGVSLGNVTPIIIDPATLPTTIEVFLENANKNCFADFGKVTSESPDLNINVTTYTNIINPGENVLFATIDLGELLSSGNYTPYIFYSLCGDNYALGIDITVNAL